MDAGSSSNDNRFKSQEVHHGRHILQRVENTKACMLIQCQTHLGNCSTARGSNVFWPKSALTQRKQVVRASLNGQTPPRSDFQARNGTHGATAATDTLASIDVEYAHFGSRRQSVTAAAEVCLLAGDGSTLWHSFIRPGKKIPSAARVVLQLKFAIRQFESGQHAYVLLMQSSIISSSGVEELRPIAISKPQLWNLCNRIC